MSGSEVRHQLSIVVPMYNERECVVPFVKSVHDALANFTSDWELLLVDDGSSDDTVEQIVEVIASYGDHVRLIALQRNFGQTAAMQAGIDKARGDVICTLDGDLQNDPADIPGMVSRLLDEGLDLVVGWRKNRQDDLWSRKIPSRIANRLIGRITGVQLHDYGCSLKVYRTDVVRGIRLYGEMHRFIPAWVATETSASRIVEHEVRHHARTFGESKYGISRTIRVLLDLVVVYFFMRFRSRPGHFFGAIGGAMGLVGGAMLSYLAVLKFMGGEEIGNRPMLMAGMLLVMAGIQFMTTGIMGEFLARTYFESSEVRPYVIRKISSVGLDEEEADWQHADQSDT